MRHPSLLLILLLISCTATEDSKQTDSFSPPWINLLSNGSFEGWEIRNGTAPFSFVGQEVVGTTAYGTPNTFLCTEAMYQDFILEFEVWVDATVNSGVQFRSNSQPDYKAGVVHGYQCEIDPSPRAWSGGIYDEQRRGWLYDLDKNPAAKVAFKNGQWNQYRIEAIGPLLRTWVNHVNTANLVDSLTTRGFIALQVHAIGDSTDAGKKIKWRNLRIITDNPETFSWQDRVSAPIWATER